MWLCHVKDGFDAWLSKCQAVSVGTPDRGNSAFPEPTLEMRLRTLAAPLYWWKESLSQRL